MDTCSADPLKMKPGNYQAQAEHGLRPPSTCWGIGIDYKLQKIIEASG